VRDAKVFFASESLKDEQICEGHMLEQPVMANNSATIYTAQLLSLVFTAS